MKMDLKILKKELAGIECELNNPGVDTSRVQEWILRREPYSEDLPHPRKSRSVVAGKVLQSRTSRSSSRALGCICYGYDLAKDA